MRRWSSTTPCSSGPSLKEAAVLGDHDRRQRRAVARAEHDQELPQGVRHDRPAEVGGRVPEQVAQLERHRGVLGRRGDLHRVVVVDPVEVERLADRGQVAVGDDRPPSAASGPRGSARAASARRTCRSTARRRAWPPRRRRRRRWPARSGRGCWRSRRWRRPAAAQRDRGPAVGEEQVVRHRERVEQQRLARARARRCRSRASSRTLGSLIGIQCSTRSTNRSPTIAAKSAKRSIGRPVQPAAVVLERLRQVPVVERDHRLDPGLEEAVDEPVVERPGPARWPARDPVGWIRGQESEKR